MEDVIDYINRGFGMPAAVRPISVDYKDRMPLYLRHSYMLYICQINSLEIILAEPEERETKVKVFQKHAEQLANLFQKEIVFVLRELDSWVRKRLLEKQIPFIEPGKQIYIPFLMLQLSDIVSRKGGQVTLNDVLSFPAQCMLLAKLCQPSMPTDSYSHLSAKLGYSTMTIGRIAKELAAAGLAVIEGRKEKSIYFMDHGHYLFKKAESLLSSPIKETWRTDYVKSEYVLKAGESAMSNFTMLGQPHEQTYAVGKDIFPSLKNSGVLGELNREHGEITIQVWHYNPQNIEREIFDTVDRLSLYLSVKDEIEDERMESALKQLLNEAKW